MHLVSPDGCARCKIVNFHGFGFPSHIERNQILQILQKQLTGCENGCHISFTRWFTIQKLIKTGKM